MPELQEFQDIRLPQQHEADPSLGDLFAQIRSPDAHLETRDVGTIALRSRLRTAGTIAAGYVPYNLEPAALEIATERVGILRKLHGIAAMPVLDEAGNARRDRRLDRLVFLEAGPPREAVDLGIEIEIYEPTLISKEEYKTMSGEQLEERRTELKRTFQRTMANGVPRDYKDGFWEFANKPVKYYETLAGEVRELIDLGLINTAHKRHPLHITIGGIERDDGPNRRQAYLFARALEATHWSTSGGRLLRPELKNTPSWLGKGQEGIETRSPDKLRIDQGHTYGIELRTFQFQGLPDLRRTLRTAYYLGSALKAYQRQGETPKDVQLAAIWESFSDQAGKLFEQYSMANPATREWDHGLQSEDDFRLGEDWHTLAHLLNEARTKPGSLGSEFVSAMRELAKSHRRDARRVMGLTNTHDSIGSEH